MSALLATLPPVSAIEAEIRHRSRNKIRRYFKDNGQTRRELYPKHIEFFAAGGQFKERLFMAANRVGKSQAGAFEVACHATGIYPDWWQGHRFTEAVEIWACGTNSETTCDIVQAELFGKVGEEGTGMVPGDLILKTTARHSGKSGSIDSAWIMHVSGKRSVIGLKTYEQGRQSFEGTAKHVIWCDEEPPLDCYTEMLYRTATTEGIVLTTFTPLQGMSAVVKSFLRPENEQSKRYKFFIKAGWKDVPHILEAEKDALIATTPPYQIDARTKGEPSLGSGAIYPISKADITCPTFAVPDTWQKVYALDVGWNRTAVVWGARNPANGQIVIYDLHYQGMGEPASHALSIKARGDWMLGVVDPNSIGSSQVDGQKCKELYIRAGLKLTDAVNSQESGILEVWQMLVSGRLKVMAHLGDWFDEFSNYHRDAKGTGKIVKTDDHLMDATRYLVVSGLTRMTIDPALLRRPSVAPSFSRSADGWMA